MDCSGFYVRDCLKFGVFDTIATSTIFDIDNALYKEFRNYLKNFMTTTITSHIHHRILEVGPKHFLPNEVFLTNSNIVDTVDIVENTTTTYVCDLTRENTIPKGVYDAIYCLEVIEHCSHPVELLKQLRKLLKPDGKLYMSFPFQFRLHGPIPDNWRISEYGIRVLAQDAKLKIESLHGLIDKARPAFPVSYTMICSIDT
jgi:SAM-dependent methyltransferase